MTLADSHVHLHAYPDDEIAAMLHRAADAGVATVVAVSVDLDSAARTIGLSHPRVRIVPAGVDRGGSPAPQSGSTSEAWPTGTPGTCMRMR